MTTQTASERAQQRLTQATDRMKDEELIDAARAQQKSPFGPGLTDKYGGSIARISSDEILNCIKHLSVISGHDPQAWIEIGRITQMCLVLLNRLGCAKHDTFPRLIEISLLNRLKSKWHYPIQCLTENPGAIHGEPKFRANCFRKNIILPGSNGRTLWLGTTTSKAANANGDTAATKWVDITDKFPITKTGRILAQIIMQELESSYINDNAYNNAMIDNFGGIVQQAYADPNYERREPPPFWDKSTELKDLEVIESEQQEEDVRNTAWLEQTRSLDKPEQQKSEPESERKPEPESEPASESGPGSGSGVGVDAVDLTY